MLNRLRFFFIAGLVIAMASITLSQITTMGSGNWSSTTVDAPWPGGVIPGPSDNVVIASGHSITMDAAGLAVQDLSISGTLEFSTTTSIDLTVNGNMSLLSGGVFRVLQNTLGISPNGGLAHSLILKGNLSHNGTTFDCRTGSAGSTLAVCNITLSGTSDNTLTVPYVSSSNGEFNYITINKTLPGKVLLGSNIVTAGGSGTGPTICNSGINFLNGIVETGSFYLAYQGTTNAQLIGASSASYVNGSLGRGMSGTTATSKDFFVGDANGYRPVYVRSTTSGVATGHLVIVKCVAGNADLGSSIFSVDIDKVSAVRYYQVTYATLAAGAASMSFDLFKLYYGSDDGVAAGNQDLRVAYSTNSRTNWNGFTFASAPVTTDGSTPTQITPDALTGGSIITLTAASTNTMFLSLANAVGGGTLLPVELQSFSAKSNRGNVELVWSTATEVNNAGFAIEKNMNGVWSKIGFVEGHGTTNTPQSYRYIDASVKGLVSYRLKQIDRDGKFEYSQSVEVNVIGTPSELSLNGNYPNPFNPTTNISFSVPFEGRAVVKVFDLLGKEIATVYNDIAVSGQQYSVPFVASSLPSGIYFSQLEFGGQKLVKKMLLMK